MESLSAALTRFSQPLLCCAPWLVESRAVLFLVIAPLAQLVEHRTLNPQVLGSSPRGRTEN